MDPFFFFGFEASFNFENLPIFLSSFFPGLYHFILFNREKPRKKNTKTIMNDIHLNDQMVHQPREKRLKVSKACFTCRVKKIKVKGTNNDGFDNELICFKT
jgi:hypothetical protein